MSHCYSHCWKVAVCLCFSLCSSSSSSSSISSVSFSQRFLNKPPSFATASLGARCLHVAFPTIRKMSQQPLSSTTVTETASPNHVVLQPLRPPLKPKYRNAYEPSEFKIRHVDLKFDLHDNSTKVESKIVLYRTKQSTKALCLDGENLTLKRLAVDGNSLMQASECTAKSQYCLKEDGKLCIGGDTLPSQAEVDFTIDSEVVVNPTENLQLMGLYKTGKLFCTQCEAEGFRRITYFLDRPDVMATYKVRLTGDKAACPVLLCNGNKIESGDCPEDPSRHYAVFEDPFPKPCYLFALVAGQLKSISDSFTTKSSRKVHLEIFSEPEDAQKLMWAMESIKRAMKWDEEAFGREYDLDVFNIVCAKDFNMGAMENKGLNIFNTALLLADEKTTTDAEFQRILNVVGHEYFHNWTGNRVTCRDWFQLTLKEGLTVFRDQQFTRCVASKSVKRIEDVLFLKTRQFSEDSGPMTHPIRPESYIAMDNFYTATVYDKGAEVIRMYDTLLGSDGFRKGMDLYFKRHDGQAVTCDDFRAAMADANNVDLKQFENWYLQSGTPLVEVVSTKYEAKKFSVTLKQSIPTSPECAFLPLHIPVRIGLLGKTSKKDLLNPPSKVLELKEMEQSFELENVEEEPVLSILRDFSAPVKVKFPQQTDEDLSFLMAYDSDHFNRWDAGQRLAMKALLDRTGKLRGVTRANRAEALSKLSPLPSVFTEAFKQCLKLHDEADMSLQAYTLCLPDEESIQLEMPRPVCHEAVHQACLSMRSELCKLFYEELEAGYNKLTADLAGSKPVGVGVARCLDKKTVGRRRLRNMFLYYLCGNASVETAGELAYKHFREADCMTDKVAGFKYLMGLESDRTEEAVKQFYDDANGDPLIVDKWFSLQALSERSDCLSRVKALQKHKDFNITNPNRLRSLIFAFARNSSKFHCLTGEGYELLRKVIVEVDKFNPQIAARACNSLIHWKLVDMARQELMKKELQCILSTAGLSNDTCEIATKGLSA